MAQQQVTRVPALHLKDIMHRCALGNLSFHCFWSMWMQGPHAVSTAKATSSVPCYVCVHHAV